METWTKTCGLPLLVNFEPQPNPFHFAVDSLLDDKIRREVLPDARTNRFQAWKGVSTLDRAGKDLAVK